MLPSLGLRVHKITYGTADITQGPAMTREQAADAILYGMNLVKELKEEGYRLIATVRWASATPPPAAHCCRVLLHRPVEEMTGRGAGLSSEGLKRKIDAIHRAIEVQSTGPGRHLWTLCHKVGGLDIAGLVGVFLGGAHHHLPIVIDGVISGAAAFTAMKFCKNCPAITGLLRTFPRSRQERLFWTLSTRNHSLRVRCAWAREPVRSRPSRYWIWPTRSIPQMSTFSEIEMEEYKHLV